MRVCLVTPGLDDNSLGRTFCLWSLARRVGYDVDVVSGAPSGPLWPPLAGTPFGSMCRDLDIRVAGNMSVLRAAFGAADVVIAVKPLPSTLGILIRARVPRRKVIVDIDDPDLDVVTNWAPWSQRLRNSRHRHHWYFEVLRLLVRRYATLVSNPVLSEIYGGTLIPHVRDDPGFGAEHVRQSPHVAFVGTVKPHKGIEVLRSAVGGLSKLGYTLTVTSDPPVDAGVWEHFVGKTTMSEGLKITAQSDVTVVPSIPGGYADGQFPAKLVDAMLAGRAIIVSDVGPLPWVVGDGAIITAPGDIEALTSALERLSSPELRAELGRRARRRALEHFTVDAVADQFQSAMAAFVNLSQSL